MNNRQSKESINIAVRGYKGAELKWQQLLTMTAADEDKVMRAAAEWQSAEMIAGRITMVEIEFLDEPNPNERFMRFGTHSAGMVEPIGIDLHDMGQVSNFLRNRWAKSNG